MNQREVKAELIEDIYREIQSVLETPKGKDMLFVFVQGLGGFIEEDGLVYVSPQASRNWLEQR